MKKTQVPNQKGVFAIGASATEVVADSKSSESEEGFKDIFIIAARKLKNAEVAFVHGLLDSVCRLPSRAFSVYCNWRGFPKKKDPDLKHIWEAIEKAIIKDDKSLLTSRFCDDIYSSVNGRYAYRVCNGLTDVIDALTKVSINSLTNKATIDDAVKLRSICGCLYRLGIHTDLGKLCKDEPFSFIEEPLNLTPPAVLKKEEPLLNNKTLAVIGAAIGFFATGPIGLVAGAVLGANTNSVASAVTTYCRRK